MKRLFLILLLLVLLILPVSADTVILYASNGGDMSATSASADWITLRNAAGTTATNNVANPYLIYTTGHASTADKYVRIFRGGINFAKPDLGAGFTIDTAKLRIKYYGKAVALGGTNEVALVIGSPTDPTTLAAADYNNLVLSTSSEIAGRVDFTTLTGDINMTFNSLGLSNLTGAGSLVVYALDGDELDGTFTGVWASSASRSLRAVNFTSSTTTSKSYIEYTYSATGGDTTPPDSITGLTNTTTNCHNITWGWTNPTTADFNHTMIWRNNTFWTNASNITTTAFWDGLPENTAMTFSSKTCDFIPNCNLTFVNETKTTNFCPAATPTPTPTPTPTATPTPAPTPALAGCLYYNLTGVYEGLNSSNWTATEGLTTWGVMTTNASQGNTSWWVCIATPTPTPTPPPWQPLVNPTTDTHYNWWKLLTDWWWLPLLILAMIILFTRR